MLELNPQHEGIQEWLGHESTAFMDGISARRKETSESSLASSTMGGYSTKKQEVGLHQILTLPASWSWTCQPPELWELNFCCLYATPSMVPCSSSLNRLRQPLASEKNLGKLLLWTSALEAYCEAQDNLNEALSSEARWPQSNPVLSLTNLVTLNKSLKLQVQFLLLQNRDIARIRQVTSPQHTKASSKS